MKGFTIKICKYNLAERKEKARQWTMDYPRNSKVF